MSFTWIPYYKEFAQKLTQFQKDRKRLLNLIYDNRDELLAKYLHDQGHKLQELQKWNVTIWDNNTYFRIDVGFSYHDEDGMLKWEKLRSGKKYPTLEKAEYAVFDAIVSGKVQEYIDKNYSSEF